VDVTAGPECTGGLLCDSHGICVECLRADDCGGGSCTAGIQTGGEACEAGVCVPLTGPLPCSPYVCGASACLDDCSENGADDCVATHYCDDADACVLLEPLGSACDDDEECVSGECDDDVCCMTDCDDDCAQCGVGGMCAPLAPLTPAPACELDACDDDGTCLVCGEDVVSPGAVSPGADACAGAGTCAISCVGGTCTITCATNNACVGSTIDCPPDAACEVQCAANDSCSNSTINCPAGYPCTVTCPSGGHRCQGVDVNCPITGTCDMDCQGGDTCDGADLHCGANRCTATCVDLDKPNLIDCSSACNAGCVGSAVECFP
jgi:hypothetical protein